MAKFVGNMDEVYFLTPDNNAYLSENLIEWDDFVPDEPYDYFYRGTFTYDRDAQGRMTDYYGIVQDVHLYHSQMGAVLEEFDILGASLNFSEFKNANFDPAIVLPKMFSGNDEIEGGGTLNGYAGNDVIRSEGGYNALTGGTGNDIYYVSPNDHITEYAGDGYDRVVSVTTFSLKNADLEALVLTGSDAIGAIGNELNNKLVGNDTGNKMQGMEGNDALYGGLGRDGLYGGLGNDTFVFDTALGSNNVDTIYDFSNVMGDNDTIRLDNAVFTALTATGRLAESAFATITSSSSVVPADAHILYDKTNGGLYYDSDGGTASGRILFAVLHNHADLTFHDFLVV